MQGEITDLLVRSREGNESASRALFSALYVELRQLAGRHLRRSRWIETLGTTMLVNEAYLRLVAQSAQHAVDRTHFLNLAAKIMRQLVCDHARRRLRETKLIDRDACSAEEIARISAEEADAQHIAALEVALGLLEEIDPRQVRVVECKYFVGMTSIEAADALGLSVRSVERAWTDARRWLAGRLADAA